MERGKEGGSEGKEGEEYKRREKLGLTIAAYDILKPLACPISSPKTLYQPFSMWREGRNEERGEMDEVKEIAERKG